MVNAVGPGTPWKQFENDIITVDMAPVETETPWGIT